MLDHLPKPGDFRDQVFVQSEKRRGGVPSPAATLTLAFCGPSAAGAGKIGVSAMKAISAPNEAAWVNVLGAMSP